LTAARANGLRRGNAALLAGVLVLALLGDANAVPLSAELEIAPNTLGFGGDGPVPQVALAPDDSYPVV
jgi:hypothetical protein